MRENITTKWQSSQLMSKKDFEVNLYRDKYFKTVEMHSHDFYEVYCFIGGAVDYIVEDGLYRLQAGDVLLIPPNYLHQPNVKDGSKSYDRIVLWINPDYVKRLSSPSTDLATCFQKAKEKGAYLVRNSALSDKLVTELIAVIENENSNSFGADLTAENHVITVLTLLGAHYLKNRQAKQAEQSKIISRAIEYISEHLTEPITLDGISNALYTNKYYFAHLFKEETGVSPHSYILKKRLLMSKELIEQGLSITDVYVRCGFSDYTHFFRAFKKEFDLTPKQYFHLIKAI